MADLSRMTGLSYCPVSVALSSVCPKYTDGAHSGWEVYGTFHSLVLQVTIKIVIPHRGSVAEEVGLCFSMPALAYQYLCCLCLDMHVVVEGKQT